MKKPENHPELICLRRGLIILSNKTFLEGIIVRLSKLGAILGPVFLTLFLSPASAQQMEGFYLGAHAGANIVQDSDINDPTFSGLGFSVESQLDTGFGAGVVMGYDFYDGYRQPIRAEVEYSYRSNDIDTLNFSAFGVSADCEAAGFNCSGDVTSHAILVNGWYDLRRNTRLRPYFGGGIGFANVELDLTLSGAGLGSASASDDDTVIAYQLGAGVGYALTERMDVSIDYRFFGTSDPEFDTTESEYLNHSIAASIRYRF